MRHADTLDPADVALLDMAVTQIEAAPYSFDIEHSHQFSMHSGCGFVLCIGGHMAILDHPEYLRLETPYWDIRDWMTRLCSKHQSWWGLFYLDLMWPLDGNKCIISDNLRERVEHWKETGE